MRIYKIAFPILLSFLCSAAAAQNYLGYSKDYIINAMKAERKDMTGPVSFHDDTANFITYVTDDNKRTVVYHFRQMTIAAEKGTPREEEICIKYVSKNKCQSFSECPEMEEVIRSLNSRFTQVGHHVWADYTKKVPQQWVLVKEDHYFEVHVEELKELTRK